jgi:hypothetical protein
MVTFTAVIVPNAPGTGTPTGSVSFYDGTVLLYTVQLMDGVATYSTAELSAGSHTIKAVYSGDADFIGSSSSLTQVVTG